MPSEVDLSPAHCSTLGSDSEAQGSSLRGDSQESLQKVLPSETGPPSGEGVLGYSRETAEGSTDGAFTRT